ncbi:MAG: hypothetical protein RLZZ490_1725 [Cyanobacteriota bacterium]
MILITVGTEKFPFNRLMQWVDELIQSKFIDLSQEDVVIQYGSCTVIPKQGQSYDLLPAVDFKALLTEARLIISHCGEGSFDLLAQINKPFILVPRSHQFGEHVDDHQIELAKALQKKGVNVAQCPGDLVRFLTNPVTVNIAETPTQYYQKASQLLSKEAGKLSQAKPVVHGTDWLSRVYEAFSQRLGNLIPHFG